MCFSSEKFRRYQNEVIKIDFDGKHRRIFKLPPRLRAERPQMPLHALCLFLCPLFEPAWEP